MPKSDIPSHAALLDLGKAILGMSLGGQAKECEPESKGDSDARTQHGYQSGFIFTQKVLAGNLWDGNDH